MKHSEAIEILRSKEIEIMGKPYAVWKFLEALKYALQVLDDTDWRDTAVEVEGVSHCRVCEKITCANKDIFWTFARTHQPGTREEFLQIPYEETRFCPACGREIGKVRKLESWEERENRS